MIYSIITVIIVIIKIKPRTDPHIMSSLTGGENQVEYLPSSSRVAGFGFLIYQKNSLAFLKLVQIIFNLCQLI